MEGAFAFVHSIGLGVDEGALDGEIRLVLLIRDLLLWLRSLVRLVAFSMALETCHD